MFIFYILQKESKWFNCVENPKIFLNIVSKTKKVSSGGAVFNFHLCVHQLCHLSNFKKIFLHKISWHMWYILVQSAATSAGYGCEELLGDYLMTVISCNFFTIFSFDSDVCFCGATCQISSPQGCILCFILQMQMKLLYISCNDTSK